MNSHGPENIHHLKQSKCNQSFKISKDGRSINNSRQGPVNAATKTEILHVNTKILCFTKELIWDGCLWMDQHFTTYTIIKIQPTAYHKEADAIDLVVWCDIQYVELIGIWGPNFALFHRRISIYCPRCFNTMLHGWTQSSKMTVCQQILDFSI